MILQALYEYYQRKAQDPDSNIAPQGLEWKEIPFLIVIDKEGNFIKLEETNEGSGKEKRSKRFLVNKSVGRSGANSWQSVNVFWDHYGYVLAHPKDESSKSVDAAKKQQSSFINDINNWCSKFPENGQFAAVQKFYQQDNNPTKILADPLWSECIKKPGTNLSFRLIGETYIVAEHPDLHLNETKNESDLLDESALKSICLITGEKTPIAVLHTATSIPGGKSGAKLVGFQKNSGYDSYYKEQGLNAPVSVKAEDAYSTALNVLLGKDSKNKYKIGDTTVVFWAEKKTILEDCFPFFFVSTPKDDPDANIREIRSFLNSVHTGILNTDNQNKFYVLGLSPNAARISVRFWKPGTIAEFSDNIMQHFHDLEMVKGGNDEREYFSLFNLLTQVSFQYKIDNLPPNIVGSVMQSIINGTLYPTTLQMQCLCRIKADRNVTFIRAAILKAYLNRKNRIIKNLKEREITMALDLENKNQGYLCGRLFAVLEKIQEDAQPGINSTIKDRFYGAASVTPITVFSRLLSLSNHHLGKLESGRKFWHEKQIQEIMDGISSNGMPAHLSLDDQSRFAIGYYQQRKDLYTSKKNSETK